jgi:ribonuclease HI
MESAGTLDISPPVSLRRVAIVLDGSSRGNPGKCACAAAVLHWCDDAWHVQVFGAAVLGHGTSVLAEFQADCRAQSLLVQCLHDCGICVSSHDYMLMHLF